MEAKQALQCAATGLSGLFAGAAMYINLGDHPARATLDTANYRKHFKEAFLRAKRFQGPLCMLGSGCALGAYYLDEGSDTRALWALGGGTFLLVLPWTLGVMMPDIKKLISDDIIETAGENWTREHIGRWNTLHMFRTAVSITSFGIFIYALSRR